MRVSFYTFLRKEDNMPGGKKLRGATDKQQDMYEHIKTSEKGEGRNGKTASRIAAATVNKYKSKHGLTK